MLLLYSGNKAAAVDLLVQHGKNNMAILVSQSDQLRFENKLVYDDANDMRVDREEAKRLGPRDVHDRLVFHLDNDAKGIMSMLSGRYAYDPQVSWKCNLGRILWYVNSNFKSAFDKLNDSINEYCDSYDYKQTPNAIHPTEKDDPLMYEILSVFVNPTEANEKIFRECGLDQQSAIVRRTQWSLLTALKSLNRRLVETDEQAKDKRLRDARTQLQTQIDKYYTKVTYEYAYELETLGLWKWAVYVVLHLDNSVHKRKFVQDLLLKYVGTDDQYAFIVEQ
mmetsp:Transcript_41802/g.48284  ORF Transcript_41802/g.48284 Transcript_41802/m.48284 type:complete len:279 (+) Transcript_41802:2528-3364(+)